MENATQVDMGKQAHLRLSYLKDSHQKSPRGSFITLSITYRYFINTEKGSCFKAKEPTSIVFPPFSLRGA